MKRWRLYSNLAVLTSYLCVVVLAFIPRVAQLGRFLTVDEADFWLTRSSQFLNALRAGDWAATAISTHPGVTTMWSGTIGIVLRELLVDWSILPGLTAPQAIALMRLPLALAHTLGVLAGYHMLRRLFAPPTALLAALLWAADPFVVAYSRLLHVDGPLTTFATLAVLSALCAWQPGMPRRGWVLISGVCAGLALLSKSPALLLPPFVALIALAAWFAPHQRSTADHRRARLNRVVIVPIALWSVAALALMLLLWPALWAAPLKIAAQLWVGIEVEGAQPHMLGNYFLGRPDPAPGALFYPVALALRLTPWTLAGLLVLALTWRGLPGRERRNLATLALFAILLAAALTLFDKKFNRYIVPTFPALDTLAAAGIVSAATALGRLFGHRERTLRALVVAVVTIAAVANIAWWHPYEIAAFNQALGGAQAGARNFVIGWGEGYELVADWLNRQPDITGVRTISREPGVQNPYMRSGAGASPPSNGALPDDAGYVVVYVGQTQRGTPSPPFGEYYRQAVPVKTIVIHDLEYAWIYQVAPHIDTPSGALFGDGLMLAGIRVRGTPQPDFAIALDTIWQLQGPVAGNANLFVHILAPDGMRVTQLDVPLALGSWEVGRYQLIEAPIMLPAGLSPGTYRVVVGVYNPQSGERFALSRATTLDSAVDGPNALELASFSLP